MKFHHVGHWYSRLGSWPQCHDDSLLWQVDTHQQVVEGSIDLRHGTDIRLFSRINRSDGVSNQVDD